MAPARPHGRFLAGEAGELVGVSGTTIGQWARRGYIRASRSTGDPHVYSLEDVAEAWVVHALLERMDTSLLGLCFDTGHCAFGGGDPLALLREAGELVNHVHFKDVDLELLARLQKEGKNLEDAWEAGVFCELGTGGAQVDDCLRQLLANDYDAWIVVEQDRVLAPGEPFAPMLAAAEHNRAWLRERGL